MKHPIIVIGTFITAIVFLIIGYNIAPDAPSSPPTVTHESKTQYSVGEKVKVNPYGGEDWGDGKVEAITSEDDYIVHYCGNYGWFNGLRCETKLLKRSQMAKTTEVKS